MPYDVFISYASQDKQVADAACVALEARGMRCWIAPRDILPGLSWASAIADGIDDSQAMVVILSASADCSQYVLREVEHAVGRRARLIAFRIEDVRLCKAMEFLLRPVNWLDALPPPPEQHLGKLVHVVRAGDGAAPSDVSPGDGPRAATPVDLWRALDAEGITVVFGRFVEGFEDFEQSGLIGFGDAMALAELQGHLASIGIRNFSVYCSDFVHGDLLRTNLVLLGGPHANTVSRDLMAAVRPTLCFGDPDSDQIAVHDAIEGRLYVPRRLRGADRSGSDYGLIVRAANPFEPTRQALLFAGSFGYGTWAGVRFATSQLFLQHKLVRAGKALECLVEAEVVRETPVNVRMVACRELASP